MGAILARLAGAGRFVPMLLLLLGMAWHLWDSDKWHKERAKLLGTISDNNVTIHKLQSSVTVLTARVLSSEEIRRVPDDSFIEFMRERGYLRTPQQQHLSGASHR